MIADVITRIRADLTCVFGDVYNWFDVNEELLNHSPKDGGWSIRKILEHISLTNHFLLILIRKGTTKAIEQSKRKDYFASLKDYDLDWDRLKLIGEHKSFEWSRPEHMEPTGTADLLVVKQTLQNQFIECLNCLEILKKGEGILHKTMMSVNDLGKIDVYHYIYFLAQHAKRHVGQMVKLKVEFEN